MGIVVKRSALQALWGTCSLFKRLGGRLIPKNSAFLRRVEKVGLAPLDGSSPGEFGDEAGGALGAGGGQRGEDLPGSRAFLGFVTTGDLAGDYGWAQLAFREIISGIDAIVIQKGKEMIALFVEPFADGFFTGFAAGRLQQLSGFAFEGLTQIREDFRAKLSFLLFECGGGMQHGLYLA